MLPYNYNRKLGFYKIGNQEFKSRTIALLESAQADNAPYIQFDFNNEFFSKVSWKKEPSENLRELYKQRALQLREKYDYVIIAYTGGSDSWTLLNAFLSNNIRVDEIIHFAPLEAIKSLEIDNNDFSPTNIATEYYLTTKPQLDLIAARYPCIKITIHDWAQGSNKVKLDSNWQWSRSANLTPQISRRWKLEDKTDSVWKHKKIGYVQGLEKPRICIKDNKYWIYFLDFIHLQTLDLEDYSNDHWTTEFFYWSPDSEKILRKQAHTIKKFFELNPSLKSYITWPIVNPNNRTFYETLVKGLIYPDYDLSLFQVNKPKSLLTFGLEELVASVNPSLYKDWQGGINELLNATEDRYKKNNDFIGFVSDFYEI